MDDVKRYDPVDEFARRASMSEETHGDYVEYDDYAALRARLEAVEKEREAALHFKLVRFENGQFDFRGGPVPAIAEYFAEMFEAGEGTYFNHMEIEFDHPKAGPMVLSAQRRNGQTPNQQRLAAESRAERAEAALATARRDALEEAAKVCNERGIAEQVNYGLNRGTQNYFRARDAIRALANEAET